jgi:TolB protein
MVGGVSYHRLATATAVTALLAFAACSSDDGENAKADKPTAAKVTAGLPTGHLLYRRYLDDEQTQAEIYAVGPGETNGHSITHPPAGWADDLAVASPDGSRMTLTRCGDRCLLFTANIDGSGVRRLSPKCCFDENSASYSPDGRTLVFGRAWGEVKNDLNQIKYSEVFTMSAAGHHRVRLTHNSGQGWRGDTGNPSFSPDGKRIVYTFSWAQGTPHAGQRAVFVMNADGSGQHRLTPWKMGAGDYPRFSPDGSRIVFRAGYEDGPGGDLYTMRPDGSDVEQLTHGLPGMLSAAYSPDGRYIAFAHGGRDGAPADIWVMRADGTHAVQLTDSPEWDSLPTWGL